MNATESLKRGIEESIGRAVESPKGFDQLKQQIETRTGEVISTSTLKRFWGYLPGDTVPRLHTLNIMSRFLGYKNWQDYQKNNLQEERQSNPVMVRHLNVQDELCVGDHLRLTWHPNRVCVVEYQGSLHFKVLESEQTRIQVGNTFDCSLIIENEPLYIDNLRQGDATPVAYVCGKKTGVRFEIIRK